MRWRALVLCGAFLSVAAGCADILGIDDGIPRDGGFDAAPPDAPVEAAPDVAADVQQAACNVASPFGAPVAITELDTATIEQHPRLSPDELTITFQRTVVDAGFDLFTATRPSTTSPFGAATPIAELDTPYSDTDLTMSADGLRAWFGSTRPGGLGSYDVWQASRDAAASPFGAIAPVTNVNSPLADSQTYYVPGALYFASNRGSGGQDIYRAAEQAGGFAAPLLVVDLASPAADEFPVVSTDELRVYFASTRGDAGGFQLYTSTRASATAAWDTPALVPELASFGNVLPAWISPDGCRLYFSSDSGGNYDLYVATKSP